MSTRYIYTRAYSVEFSKEIDFITANDIEIINLGGPRDYTYTITYYTYSNFNTDFEVDPKTGKVNTSRLDGPYTKSINVSSSKSDDAIIFDPDISVFIVSSSNNPRFPSPWNMHHDSGYSIYSDYGTEIQLEYSSIYTSVYHKTAIRYNFEQLEYVAYNEKQYMSRYYTSNRRYGSLNSIGIDDEGYIIFAGNSIHTDNIDPYSISYPNTFKSGDQINITISPRSSRYGGTFYYQYQYSPNSGSTWIDIENTTDTSILFTTPTDLTSFIARVKVSDTWGFTSNDWITGNLVSVTPSSTIYTSYNGAIRTLTPYPCVANSIRSNIQTKYMVNGVIR